MITIRTAKKEDAATLTMLLAAANLKAEDVDIESQQYWLAESDGLAVGCIGLERAGKYGWLRSLAVSEPFRNRGVARMLCEHLLKENSADEIYLLTISAEQYFLRYGFTVQPRDSAPAEIRQLKQFAVFCSSTAILMKKSI